ncbi:MAG TPA: hypothetical protein PLQ54_12265, partial [Armatimonadota bacterium]|nr:hypothetical protein [Armatimonadota bacterium]
PSVLTRTFEVPKRKKTELRLTVGHHPEGDWLLQVKVDGQVVLEQPVTQETAPETWTEVEVDLSRYAGKTVRLELVNQPTGWMCEAAYWARVAIESR